MRKLSQVLNLYPAVDRLYLWIRGDNSSLFGAQARVSAFKTSVATCVYSYAMLCYAMQCYASNCKPQALRRAISNINESA
jgi:hypothetical protein